MEWIRLLVFRFRWFWVRAFPVRRRAVGTIVGKFISGACTTTVYDRAGDIVRPHVIREPERHLLVVTVGEVAGTIVVPKERWESAQRGHAVTVEYRATEYPACIEIRRIMPSAQK